MIQGSSSPSWVLLELLRAVLQDGTTAQASLKGIRVENVASVGPYYTTANKDEAPETTLRKLVGADVNGAFLRVSVMAGTANSWVRVANKASRDTGLPEMGRLILGKDGSGNPRIVLVTTP